MTKTPKADQVRALRLSKLQQAAVDDGAPAAIMRAGVPKTIPEATEAARALTAKAAPKPASPKLPPKPAIPPEGTPAPAITAKPEQQQEKPMATKTKKTPKSTKKPAESKLTKETPRSARAPGAARKKPAEAKPLPEKPDMKATTKGSEAKAKPLNKSDIVEQMLLAPNGATREELSKASGWPYVNLKMAAKRAGKTLKEADGRFRLIS